MRLDELRTWLVAALAVLVVGRGAAAAPLPLPPDITEINAKEMGARGDGVTDDTSAIQNAMTNGRVDGADYYGQPRTVFFPKGTYLISNTLKWVGCCLSLIGEGSGETIIRLKDRAAGFGDPSKPKPMLATTDGNYSFRDSVMALTIDTGSGNPGAQGIRYLANNSGTLGEVAIRSGDGSGVSGVDMTLAWPGPCFVRNVSIEGFDVGIDVGNAEYGPTFEHIFLSGQRVAGMRNAGNSLAIRDLRSTNSVVAIQNTSKQGLITLLDSTLTGGTASANAIDNAGGVFARNVTVSGYASAIKSGVTTVQGPHVQEWVSAPVQQLFESPQHSIGLKVEDTPVFHDADLTQWVRGFGTQQDITNALETALASGKSTVYVQTGVWYLTRPLAVPASVRRVIGFGSVINSAGATLSVEAPGANPLIIEQFGNGLTIEHASSRTLVLKHGVIGYRSTAGAGDLFLEDVEGYREFHGPQRVWARQVNTESLGAAALKLWNDGATLWLMGIKAEGLGPVMRTSGHGISELFGTLIYPVHPVPPDMPMFINEDSSHSLVFAVSAYATDYSVYVDETRGSENKKLLESQTDGRLMPLFVGYRAADVPPPDVSTAMGGASGAGSAGAPAAGDVVAAGGSPNGGASNSSGAGGRALENVSGAAGNGGVTTTTGAGQSGSGGASAGRTGTSGSAGPGGTLGSGASIGAAGAAVAGSSSGCSCQTARANTPLPRALLLLGLSFVGRRRRATRPVIRAHASRVF